MSYRTNRLDEQVLKLLQAGGVGFMPSDTIYGLSCRAQDKAAVERIYRLKQRDSDKPLIVLIASVSQLAELNIDKREATLVEQYWPGAVTLICKSDSPNWLQRGTKSLAIRQPKKDVLRQLIEETGPIVSTSANLQGGEPASSVKEAQDYFGDQLDFYVDAGDMSGREPSTLVRNNNGKLEVIRPGAVKIKE